MWCTVLYICMYVRTSTQEKRVTGKQPLSGSFLRVSSASAESRWVQAKGRWMNSIVPGGNQLEDALKRVWLDILGVLYFQMLTIVSTPESTRHLNNENIHSFRFHGISNAPFVNVKCHTMQYHLLRNTRKRNVHTLNGGCYGGLAWIWNALQRYFISAVISVKRKELIGLKVTFAPRQ
jgi:hypothetical protein